MLGATCKDEHDCEYVFRSKDDQLTDQKFLAGIRSASQKNANFFTKNQLYISLCPQFRVFTYYLFAFSAVFTFLCIGFMLTKFKYQYIAITGFIAFCSIIIAITTLFYRPISLEKFDTLLQKWLKKRGHIEKLIDRKYGTTGLCDCHVVLSR